MACHNCRIFISAFLFVVVLFLPVFFAAAEPPVVSIGRTNVTLTVLYKDVPVGDVAVSVYNSEGELAKEYPSKTTDVQGKVRYELPLGKQFTFRIVSKKTVIFDKFTQTFSPPNFLVFDVDKNQAPQIKIGKLEQILEGSKTHHYFEVTDSEGDAWELLTAKDWPKFATLQKVNDTKAEIILKPGYHDAGEYSMRFWVREKFDPAKWEAQGKKFLKSSPMKPEYIPTEEELEAKRIKEFFEEEDPIPVISLLQSEATVSVIVLNANRPPVMEAVKDQEMYEGEVLEIPVHVWDADEKEGISGKVHVIGLPSFGHYSDHKIVFKPKFSDDGNYPMTIVADDIRDPTLQVQNPFELRVLNFRRPPVITPIKDLTIMERDMMTIEIKAMDPERPRTILQYKGEDLPVFASINGNKILFQPSFSDAGNYVIKVIAFNKEYPTLRSSAEFKLTVDNTDQPPVFSPIEDQRMREGETLEVPFKVRDVDFQTRPIIVAPLSLPYFAKFKKDKIIFKPGLETAHEYTITLQAVFKHNEFLKSRETFRLIVHKAPYFQVSGLVMNTKGVGIKGATIRAGGQRTKSNDRGEYTLKNILEGNQEIFVEKKGYVFIPDTRTVNVKAMEAALKVDFSGSLVPVLNIQEPVPEALVASTTLPQVLGYGSGTVPDRLEVNGIEATVKTDSATPGDVHYSFIAKQIPLEIGKTGKAAVKVVAYDSLEREVAKTVLFVFYQPFLVPEEKDRQDHKASYGG